MSFTRREVRSCAAAAVLVCGVLLTGCTTTLTGVAVRGANTGRTDVPELKEARLDDVMLSTGEVNGLMGSTTMIVTSQLERMTDHSQEVSDSDCLGVVYGAEEPVYDGTDWTAMRDQVLREPGDNNDHWVEQTAVLYPSADKAQRFFDKSRSMWQGCANSAISVDDGSSSYVWQINDVKAEDALITQSSEQENADGWACQHALSVASNLTVEAWACGFSLKDEAASIATEMMNNAAKK